MILGEARYSILMDRKTCDFAVVIADDMAGKGLGARLMNRLIDAARSRTSPSFAARCWPTTNRCSP